MSKEQIQSSLITWKVFATAPLLLSAFWVLRGYHELQRHVSGSDLLVVLLLLLVSVFLFVSIIHQFVRDPSKTAIIACICLIAFFFYGELQIAFIRWGWEQLSRFRYLLSLTFVFAAIAIWMVKTSRKQLKLLNLYLATVLTFLLVYEVIGILRFQDTLSRHQYIVDRAATPVSPAAERKPDVYYIILDSYTSAESLREFWNYDNSDFLNYLNDKGFYVVEKARSNYSLTIYSLASTLNMSYLNVPHQKAPNFAYRAIPMRDLIQRSLVAQTFMNMGYDIVNLSLFDLWGYKKFFSYPLYERQRLLQVQLFRKTLLGTLINNLYLDIDPETPIKVADALHDVATQKSARPRFIYSHFMIPHAPYLLDSQGNLKPFRNRLGKVSREIDRQLYLEQLSYTNSIIKRTLEAIFKNSTQAPVIVLQGDHGSWCFDGIDGERETTTILNAIYVPALNRSAFYDGMTPVNSFRIIFDSYFHTKFGLLPDKVFVVDDSRNVSLLRH